MSLPPALLKRLASRGIINNDGVKKQKTSHSNKTSEQQSAENEEIIAEDYDEIEDPSQYDYEPLKKPQESFWKERMKLQIVEGNNSGYKGCPNKYNIYHKCTLYCVTKWGDGIQEPKRSYMKRRQRLLRKFPLPKTWQEIYDFGCGCYYYWNSVHDTVSWLPPNHPKAIISKSAAALRKELEEIQLPQLDDNENDGNSRELTEEDIEKILNLPKLPPPKRPESPLNDIQTHQQSNVIKKPKSRDLDKAIRQQKAHKRQHRSGETNRDNYRHRRDHNNSYGRGNNNDDPLDPMDPASYSDIPRGKWSDGLNIDDGNHKTGVDPTVSGSYQQRPYPSPGAVLQANSNKIVNSQGSAASNLKKNRQPNPNDNFEEDEYY